MNAGRHIFIGGRDRGLNWLHRLHERRQLPRLVVCLQEDDHESEKHSPQILAFCSDHGIPCRLRKRLLAPDEAEIAASKPDLIVVMGWRNLIRECVLSVPRFGSVGVHESLLPRYRGFAPINWAVINGETETGVSLFHLSATGIDNGDLVGQVHVPIMQDDTAIDVYHRTAQASIELLETHFDALLAGRASRTTQDDTRATYTCARTPEDGMIDWTQPTPVIHNLVRGLASPYPGAFSYYAGKRFRIWSGQPASRPRSYVGRIPGRVIGILPGHGVEVLTGDGVYCVCTAAEDNQPPASADTLFRSIRGTFCNRVAD